MDLLLNQVDVEVGGDVDQFRPWDPNPRVDGPLPNQLGGRVTNEAPLRLLWEKTLTRSDMSGQQARFVFRRDIVENRIFRCLNFQQRYYLCSNNEAEIQIDAFDERGRKWVLKLKKRTQSGNDSVTYVAIGDYARMVRENRWNKGAKVKIWGLPYGGRDDLWRFGPYHDFSVVTLVFTATV